MTKQPNYTIDMKWSDGQSREAAYSGSSSASCLQQLATAERYPSPAVSATCKDADGEVLWTMTRHSQYRGYQRHIHRILPTLGSAPDRS